MVFPNSNLPATAQPWARDVQKRIEKVESNVKANELNNTARDVQLENNYKRIDATVNGLIVADAAAATALAQANTAIEGVSDIVNTIYVTGTETINGAVVASGTLSASKITAGTMSGDRITGGIITGTTITGSTLATAGNRHVEVSGTNIAFFDEGGTPTGSISGSGATRASAVQMISSSSTGIYAYNGGSDIVGPGCTLSVGNSGNNQIALNASGGILMNDPVTFSDVVSGGISASGEVAGSSLRATGLVSGSSLSITGSSTTSGIANNSGNITNGGTLSNTGNINSPATYGNTAASGRVMYVAANGTYNCSTSSARYKQDITPYAVDLNKFMQLEPVSFRYKRAVEEHGEQADIAHGFIAEQATEIGLTEFVDFELDENGNPRPDNFRYIDFTAAMYSVVKSQQATIRSLTARIEALESKV